MREGGREGEARYGAATTVALATATEGDSAMGQNDLWIGPGEEELWGG